MKGGTLFSGIGAPEVAMPWVDWRWCAEIDPFASALLAHRYPDTPAADGPRYRAIGNSMAVPVVSYIGDRIRQFEALGALREAAD